MDSFHACMVDVAVETIAIAIQAYPQLSQVKTYARYHLLEKDHLFPNLNLYGIFLSIFSRNFQHEGTLVDSVHKQDTRQNCGLVNVFLRESMIFRFSSMRKPGETSG